MPKNIQPHHNFLERVLSRPDLAGDLLYTFLPSPVVEQLRIDSLELRAGSFVDEALRSSQSDLLFSVDLRDGEPGLVYTLIEHKSHPDRLVAFQLLRYMVRVWERHRRDAPRAPSRLPPILPIVVYHGRVPWRVPIGLRTVFDGPPEVTLGCPDFEYHLVDVRAWLWDRVPPHSLLLGGVLLTWKALQSPSWRPKLVKALQILAQHGQDDAVSYVVKAVLNYVNATREGTTPESLRQIVDEALGERGDPILSTWLQELKEEGRVEGLLELIELEVSTRFGDEGDRLVSDLTRIQNPQVLRSIFLAVRSANDADEVRRIIARH